MSGSPGVSGLVRVALLLLGCVALVVVLLAASGRRGAREWASRGALNVAIGLWLLSRRHEGKP